MRERFDKSRFAETLAALMRERGVNQSDLQRDTGISNQAISYWLSEKREPRMTHLWTLADYFSCSIDALVGRSERR